MKVKRLAFGCAVVAMTLAGGAAANEIYKRVDDDGNVYYEDRPTGAEGEERLDITYRRTDSGAVRQRVQARLDTQTAREEARSVAAAEEAEAAEKRAAEEERAKRCENSRARLESYLQSRRLYRTDENGERVYLDEAQIQEARRKAEEQIAENCS